MGKGYFLKGKQCKGCQLYEGTSPSGKVDRGIGADGYCEQCWRTGKAPEGLNRIVKGQLTIDRFLAG